MKLKILILALIISSCGNTFSNEQRKLQKADTIKTIGWFMVDEDTIPRLDVIFKIAHDSIKVDSLLHAKLIRDTTYFRPRIFFDVDSVTGKPKLDSLGNKTQRVIYVTCPKSSIIWSPNINIDSILKIRKGK